MIYTQPWDRSLGAPRWVAGGAWQNVAARALPKRVEKNKRNWRRNSGQIKSVAAELRALLGLGWCPAAPLQRMPPVSRLPRDQAAEAIAVLCGLVPSMNPSTTNKAPKGVPFKPKATNFCEVFLFRGQVPGKAAFMEALRLGAEFSK